MIKNMKELFDKVSSKCSKITTQSYSTSFSLGILCLGKGLRKDIYAIYGFVRFADEIVDSFHDYDKKKFLDAFIQDTFEAIENKLSLNPILNSFQDTVNRCHVDHELIHAFFRSMEMDLHQKSHDNASFKEYILGSAEVVGLMCLRVFCHGNADLYEYLKPHAMSLGAAFQKINFLRDLKADVVGLGRNYFPGIDIHQFNDQIKSAIETSIATDFQHALTGIRQLPRDSRFGVYVAYVYYLALFKKIKNTPPHDVLRSRIRIRNRHKATLLAYSYVKHQLNML